MTRTVPITRACSATAMLVASLVAAACGGGGSSTPSSPTVTPTTETFTGTVPVGGSDTHAFTVVLSNGELSATLTAAGPPPTIYMGLAFGLQTASGCTQISGASTLAQAGPAAQLSGAVNAGPFCVIVFDAGNQTTDVTYSLTVTHF